MESIVGLKSHLADRHGVPASTPRSDRLVTDARLIAAPSSTAVRHPVRDCAEPAPGFLADSLSSTRGSRREVRQNMEDKGFITDFNKSGYGPLGDLFLKVAFGIDQRVLMSTARAVMQYTSWAWRQSACDPWDAITSESMLLKYVAALKPVFRPASVRNLVQFLHKFLVLAGAVDELSRHVPPRVRPKRKRALDVLRKLWNEAERLRCGFQKRRLLNGDFTPVNMLAVRTYMHDRSVEFQVRADLAVLEQGCLEGNEKRWNGLVSHLVISLTEQGPRLSALQGLRAREFYQAKAVGGYLLVRGGEHKTEGSFGDFVLVIRNYDMELFNRFAQLRSRFFPRKVHFFIKADGKSITPKVLAPLNTFLSGLGERKANHTDVRRTITGLDRQFNHCGEANETVVDSFLNHSRNVADRNYYYRTDTARLAEYLTTLAALEQCYLVQLVAKRGILPRTPMASFPSKERVFDRLEKDRVSLGIVATEIKSCAWLSIRQDWRTKQFEPLLATLEQRVRDYKPGGFPIVAVKSVVKLLDQVWSGESNLIESCLFRRIL